MLKLIRGKRVNLNSLRNLSSSQSYTVFQEAKPALEQLPLEDEYDVVINGGGIVGLSFLLALQRSTFLKDKKILLLEQQKPVIIEDLDINKERFLSNRVSSLTGNSKKFLQDVETWELIKDYAKDIKAMHVWANDYKRGVTFAPSTPTLSLLEKLLPHPNINDNSVCHIVENNIILNALNKKIDQSSVCYQAGITEIKGNKSSVLFKINDEDRTFCTSLLVGCDGFNSFVRKRSDLNYKDKDLKQKAIVGTIELVQESEMDENNIAYQRFVSEDNFVLALLPLTQNYTSFVLSAPEKIAEDLMQLSDSDFVDSLNQTLLSSSNEKVTPIKSAVNTIDALVSSMLPKSAPNSHPPLIASISENSRACFPLHFGTTLPNMVGSPIGLDNKKIVLIGDAAHRIHPLAGQGLNLGLGDAEALLNSLNDSLSIGENLFGYSTNSVRSLQKVLLGFESNRVYKLMVMMSAIQSMQMIFSYVPTSALSIFNGINFLKNGVVRYANKN